MSVGGLITVIIPTRNAGVVIDACLESLRIQKYRQYEVCVIDGLSTDDTVEKVNAYAGTVGEALTCLSEPDLGVYDAMNKGIARARCEWLYFLGADDVLHDADVFSDVTKFIAADDADIVYGDVVEKNSLARYGGEFSLDRLLFESNLCHQGAFYRRALFERLGGYNTRYPIWADWEFNIRCFRYPEIRARWMDRLIAVYREKSGISREEDPVFSKELPVILMRESAARQKNRARATGSTTWSRLCGSLFRWLN